MFENPLLRALQAGLPSVGSWITTPDPVWAELIASCGFDHVIVDLQHGSTDVATLVPPLVAIRSGGSVPVVRVPVNDPATIGRGPVKRTFDLPAGEPRLTAQAVGVHGVWVNGTRIVGQGGERVGSTLPGKVLRSFASEATS